MTSTKTANPPTLQPAIIEVDDDGITVRVEWEPRDDLDRLDVMAWGLRHRHLDLAERLKKAIDDGAVIRPNGPYTDINGARGWHSHAPIRGRAINADLRALGY